MRCLEPLLQPVFFQCRAWAATAAGTARKTVLCSAPGQRRSSGNLVLRNNFTLITQIVGLLAISLVLAALGPGLSDQLASTRILQHAAAQRVLTLIRDLVHRISRLKSSMHLLVRVAIS